MIKKFFWIIYYPTHHIFTDMMILQNFRNKSLYLYAQKTVQCRNFLRSFSTTSLKHKLSFEDRLKWNNLNKFNNIPTSQYLNQIKRMNKRNLESSSIILNYIANSELHLPTVYLKSNHGNVYKTFFFNYPETCVINSTQFMKKKPQCNHLFLTRLRWGNISGLYMWLKNVYIRMFFIESGSKNPDNQVTIYGPKGVEDYVTGILKPMISKVQCDKLWPHLLFVEVEDRKVIDISGINITAHEIVKNNIYMYEVNQVFETEENKHGLNLFIAEISNKNHTNGVHDKLSSLQTDSDKSHVVVQQIVPAVNSKQFMQELPNWNVLTPHYMDKYGRVDGWALKHLIRSACNRVSQKFFPLYDKKSMFDKTLLTESNFLQLCDFTQLRFNHLGMNERCAHAADKYTRWYNDLKTKVEGDDLNVDPLVLKKSGDFPKLTVLGSGNGSDGNRNCSAYLLHTTEDRSVLIDCGPGTLEGLLVHYGSQKFLEVISTIKVVYITHKHTDHVGGLASLIHEISKLNRDKEGMEKIILCGPPWLHTLLRTVVSPKVFKRSFVLLNFGINFSYQEHKICDALDVKDFKTVAAVHGPLTKGIVMETNVGNYKFSFSSDTTPFCRDLMKFGYDSDLLVHECTFLDPMVAQFKQHSDLQGAIDTAKQMRAKNLMLTHLSSQFPIYPIPDVDDHLNGYQGNVFCAMDNMEFSLGDVEYLGMLKPSLENVFSHSIERFKKKHDNRKDKKSDRRKEIFLKSLS